MNSNLESARIILEIMKFIKLLIFIFMYILKYNIPLFTWNAKVAKQVIEVSKAGYCFLPTEAPSHQFCRWVGNSICSFWNQTIQCLKQKAKVSLLLTLTKTSFKITFFFSCNHKATTASVWVVRDGLPSQLPWRHHPGPGLVLALWWVACVGTGWGPHVWDGQRYRGDLKMLSLGVERRTGLLPSGRRSQEPKVGRSAGAPC